MRRILRATLNTVNGLRAATASEAAFRQELIALAKKTPGKYSYASGSSAAIVSGATFASLAGLDLLHVPNFFLHADVGEHAVKQEARPLEQV